LRAAALFALGLALGCGSSTTDPPTAPEPDVADPVEDVADVVEPDTAEPDTGPVDAGPPPPPADPYTIQALDDERINSFGDVNFQNAVATVDFRDGPFEKVTLIVDLGTTCFPFDWTPPAGMNWPEDCDAFDRNFEFTLDDPVADDDPPAVELVRAITPFGGPMHFEVDVTDVANAMPGEHQLRGHITTWSDGAGKVSGSAGGWNISARFEVDPGPPPRKVLAMQRLFNWSHGPLAEPAQATITVPAGTTSTRIEYRVTGHGGAQTFGGACIGPAEEFCKREHIVTVDGSAFDKFEPWRTDCADFCTLVQGPPFGQYCEQNPCGAIQSVQAPRANWCPGSLTPPYLWDVPALLQPGEHTFGYEIPAHAEGGSWRVSVLFFAFGD